MTYGLQTYRLWTHRPWTYRQTYRLGTYILQSFRLWTYRLRTYWLQTYRPRTYKLWTYRLRTYRLQTITAAPTFDRKKILRIFLNCCQVLEWSVCLAQRLFSCPHWIAFKEIDISKTVSAICQIGKFVRFRDVSEIETVRTVNCANEIFGQFCQLFDTH